ncbi:MAG: hypothetical protein QOF76_3962 [Solirubrobacteraceae bacterium]|jgi:hypothetical protein|nr:hypothetical protein [Solirubrobacteraceae bacterium]
MTSTDTLTIRPARAVDDWAVERLAALDSQRPLSGDVLLAEADGRPVAAIAVADGRVTADPFVLTATTVALLHARAGQLRAGTLLGREYSRRIPADAAAPCGHPRAAQAPRGLSLTRQG